MTSPSRHKNVHVLQERTKAGVRYIAEDLIRRVSGQDHFELITSLNLTLAKDGGKIKYIENLEKLKKLEVLNLSNNCIERIEKLEKLIRLRELDLSFNCIAKIEGLSSLNLLQILDLSGNQIEVIPTWFSKTLKALRVFRVDLNQLHSLHELWKLRPLSNLVELSVANNPVAQLPHCRLYLIFHLRSLQKLDEINIESQERHIAHERFAQEELEKLVEELEATRSKYDLLAEAHSKSLHEAEERDRKHRSLEEVARQLQVKLKEMNGELETKAHLLKKKSSEVSRACEKHYALEQELAFYKIDHKFELLSRQQDFSASEDSAVSDDGNSSVPGESPYIGKSRFRFNEHAVEHHVEAGRCVVQYGKVTVSGHIATLDGKLPAKHDNASGSQVNGIISDDHGTLEMKLKADEEFHEKIRTIKLMDKTLQEQSDNLENVEEKLSSANARLHELNELWHKENFRKQLYNGLCAKVSTLHALNEDARRVEQSILNIEQDVLFEETELKRLRNHLMQTDARDPQHNVLQAQIADGECRSGEVRAHYQQLNVTLQEKLQLVEREAQDVQQLKEQLTNEDKQDHNGELTTSVELERQVEAALSSLNGYISTVRDRFFQQTEHLSQERLQAARDSEIYRELLKKQADEIGHLKIRLTDLDESLLTNESQRAKLEESEVLSQQTCRELQAVQEELRSAQQALVDLQDKREAENLHHNQALTSERKKLSELQHRIRNIDGRDQELDSLRKQLTELQNANTRLKDQLHLVQQRLSDQKQKTSSLDSVTLKQRLREVSEALRHYRNPGLSTTDSGAKVSDDEIERSLSDLQENIKATLRKGLEDHNHAMRAKEKLERKVAALKDEIIEVQKQERLKADNAIQAVYEKERQVQVLRNEIVRLENELQKARQEASQNSVPLPRNPQSIRSWIEESGSKSPLRPKSESSSSSSSHGTVHRRLIDTMTDEELDLFHNLQEEIVELRDRLADRDHHPVPEYNSHRLDSGQVPKKNSNRSTLPQDGRAVSKHHVRDVRSGGTDHHQHTQNPVLNMNPTDSAHSQADASDGEYQRYPHRRHYDIQRQCDDKPSFNPHSTRPYPNGTNSNPHSYQPFANEPSFNPHSNRPYPNGTNSNPHPYQPFANEPSFNPHSNRPYPNGTNSNPHPYQPCANDPSFNHPHPYQPFADESGFNQSTLAFPNLSNYPASMHRVPNHISPSESAAFRNSRVFSGVPGPSAAGMSSGLVRSAYAPIVLQCPPAVVPSTANAENKAKLITVTQSQSGQSNDHLMCNIPEHHHLEDYIAKLTQKNRQLKNQSGEPSSRRRAVLESGARHDKKNRRKVRQLLKELHDRQAELEALDLAVESQKRVCERLSVEERTVLAELRRNEAVNDLKQDLQHTEADMRRKCRHDELEYLERTIASRQAELRETDRFLLENREKLDLVRLETDALLSSQEKIVNEAATLEQQIKLASTTSLTVARELAQLREEIVERNEEKSQLVQTLTDIGQIIALKDEEFRKVVRELNTAKEWFQKEEDRRAVTFDLQQLRQAVDTSNEELEKARDELEQVKRMIDAERRTCEQVHKEVSEGHQDLQLLVDAINKRHLILEALDLQLESEITRRQQDIKKTAREHESLLNEKQQLEEEIRKGHNQVSQELIAANFKRSKELEVEAIQQEKVQCLVDQLKQLEYMVTSLNQEKTLLEASNSELASNIAQLTRERTASDELVGQLRKTLTQVSSEVDKVESTVTESRQRGQNTLDGEAPQSHGISESVDSSQLAAQAHKEREFDRVKTVCGTQFAASSLEERVKNIGEELDRKALENDRLSSALQQTKLELDLHTTELKEVKETASLERSSLEITMQRHLDHANHLAQELAFVRVINMELQRRLDAHEHIGERESSLVDALHSLKTDLKHEVSESVLKIGRSHQLNVELSELQLNNDDLRQCIDDLRQNVHEVKDINTDISSASAKDYFTDQQELLKLQLRQRMERHAESVNSQKTLSQNTIKNFRRKLTNLEQVLSQTDAAKLAQLGNKNLHMFCEPNSTTPTSCRQAVDMLVGACPGVVMPPNRKL